MRDAIVIIPTYNEIENIEAIIRAVFSNEKLFDILIVDDNSPDLTGLRPTFFIITTRKDRVRFGIHCRI